MIDLWLWRAWSAGRERLCDAGWCKAETSALAIAQARQIMGGPHLYDIDEIEVDPLIVSDDDHRHRMRRLVREVAS